MADDLTGLNDATSKRDRASLDWADAVSAAQSPSDGLSNAGPKRPAAATSARRGGGVLVAAGAALFVLMFAASGLVNGATSEKSTDVVREDPAAMERRIADLAGERNRREDEIAALERRMRAKQSELEAAERRLAGVEARRAELIAELDAPPSEDMEAPEAAATPDADPSLSAAAEAAPAVATAPKTPAEAPPLPIAKGAVAVAAPRVSDDQPEVAAPRRAGAIRVFIHVRAGDPNAVARAHAVASELRSRGVDVAAIRGVPHVVRKNAVRYFYDADQPSVSALQDAVRDASSEGGIPVGQDYRGYRAPPRLGTVELWLS